MSGRGRMGMQAGMQSAIGVMGGGMSTPMMMSGAMTP